MHGSRYASTGRIKLVFTCDPVNPDLNCWGLRMAGNVTNYFRELSEVSSRLTWDTSGLDSHFISLFGIQYDAAENYTYVGIRGVSQGAVLTIR